MKNEMPIGSYEQATKNPIHAGEILIEEFLVPMGETQAAFADKLGWTKASLTN